MVVFRAILAPTVLKTQPLWNTVYLQRATGALRIPGQARDDALLQYFSPLGWEHINLTGDYLWRSRSHLRAGTFRPLRPLSPP
jgi:Tn3 transposase DDE domain